MATDEHMQAAVNADANSSNVENPDINMPDAGVSADFHLYVVSIFFFSHHHVTAPGRLVSTPCSHRAR